MVVTNELASRTVHRCLELPFRHPLGNEKVFPFRNNQGKIHVGCLESFRVKIFVVPLTASLSGGG